jgi:hypothetical protein
MAFAPVFPRTFPGTFDRHAPAAAVAVDWWPVAGKTCVAAYQPKGAASLAASYSNLANPGTYDAAPGTAPSFDTSTGWTFNGSTQYLTTGVIITSGDWTMLVRFASGSTSGGVATGVMGNGGRFDLLSNWFASGVYYRNGNASNTTVSPSLASGVIGLTKANGYRNGTADVTLATDGQTYINPVLIGKANTFFGSVSVLAAVIYSATLTAGEVATVSAAMAAL